MSVFYWWSKTRQSDGCYFTSLTIHAIVSWLVNNSLELICKQDYSIVESAPEFSLGNTSTLFTSHHTMAYISKFFQMAWWLLKACSAIFWPGRFPFDSWCNWWLPHQCFATKKWQAVVYQQASLYFIECSRSSWTWFIILLRWCQCTWEVPWFKGP